jgi:DNA mismatch endonuclease (patch repair protein)
MAPSPSNFEKLEEISVEENMADMYSKEKRSEIMSKVRSKNTKIELEVRKALWARGVRYRIHNSNIPGTPDISSKKNKVAVFLDGCFWHGCKKHGSIPKTNTKFWKDKINENIKRREKVKTELKKEGFTVLEYYECDLRKNMAGIIDEITQHFRY